MLAHLVLFFRMHGLATPLTEKERVVMEAVRASGRCASTGAGGNERWERKQFISPGQAPVVRFRYFEGVSQHRFSNQNLMLDDAGH